MIRLTNIVKKFDGVFEPVLKGINLSIKKGEFCTIVGANGSGKSTLLKIISGEHRPTSGKLEKNGMVSQVVQDVNKGTIPEMTMLENIVLSKMEKPKFSFYKNRRTEIFEQMKTLNFGLEKFIDQPLKFLSGGQRQTVATVMAINSGGEILLLDEHTSALDPHTQKKLMTYTAKAIEESKLTTLMITHSMEDALKYGNRLIMMHKGKIVADLNCEEKKKLTMQTLLGMFRNFEDEDLLNGEENVN